MKYTKILFKDNYNRLLLIVTLALLGLSVLFSLETYYSDIANAQSAALLRLEGIAQSVALQIDGDKHEAITQKYFSTDAINSSKQNANYDALHNILKKNADATMLNTPIYTLILDSMRQEFYFIATSSETPYFRHPYPTFPPQLKQKYKNGGTISMFSDMLGTWLSAFSPILNSQNKQVGIVMIDEKFDDFIMKAKKTALIHLLYGLLLSLPIIGLLVVWVRGVLRSESELKNKIKQSLDENVKTNIALEKSYEQLSKVETQRKEMIANISHDLRTPIGSILGYVETVLIRMKSFEPLALSNELPEGSKLIAQSSKLLESSMREGTRLKKLINDLFDLSRLETPQLVLHKEKFSFAEILQDTFMGYEKKFLDNHITHRLKIQNNNTFFVFADMALINRLLQNLFDNAIKHNTVSVEHISLSVENISHQSLQSNFPTRFFEAKLFEQDGKIRCTISNSSEFLSLENLEHLFDRYFTSTSENGGTGLGLSIVKKISDVHNANIKVAHENGVTSFTFEIDKP